MGFYEKNIRVSKNKSGQTPSDLSNDLCLEQALRRYQNSYSLPVSLVKWGAVGLGAAYLAAKLYEAAYQEDDGSV